MKKFNFEITFICANSLEHKTILKEYKAVNYIQAKRGIKLYCAANSTYKRVLAIYSLKGNVKSVNYIGQKE